MKKCESCVGLPVHGAYFSYFHFRVLPRPKFSMCECLHDESHLRCDLMTSKQHQLAIWYLITSTPFHTAVKVFLVSKADDIFCYRLSGSSKNTDPFKYYLNPFLSRSVSFMCVFRAKNASKPCVNLWSSSSSSLRYLAT